MRFVCAILGKTDNVTGNDLNKYINYLATALPRWFLTYHLEFVTLCLSFLVLLPPQTCKNKLDYFLMKMLVLTHEQIT